MDAISLVQTIIPLMLAIIFTIISVKSLEELILEQIQSVLAPIWCLLASVFWITFGVVNIYGTTTDYLSVFSFGYIGIGLLFLGLTPVAVLLDIKLSAADRRQRDMDLDLSNEEW